MKKKFILYVIILLFLFCSEGSKPSLRSQKKGSKSTYLTLNLGSIPQKKEVNQVSRKRKEWEVAFNGKCYSMISSGGHVDDDCYKTFEEAKKRVENMIDFEKKLESIKQVPGI